MRRHRWPLDSPTEPWPQLRYFGDRYNFSLSTDPLPYPARNISQLDFYRLSLDVFAGVHQHINLYGNELLPNDRNIDGPVEFIQRDTIKFEICRIFGAIQTQILADPDEEDWDGLLRWEDISPIMAMIRTKMIRDQAFRERAVWINHRNSDVRLGMAKVVYRTPGYTDDDLIERGRCD
ncbi:MAG: hypothetical protein Q9168_006788 [Polycauliona sp. 1 TL-2023]